MTQPRKTSRVLFAALFSAGGAVVLAGWAWLQYQQARHVAVYQEASAPERVELLEEVGPPPNATATLQVARTLGRDVFPADHQRALDLARLAATQDPLRSTVWLEVAREQLYLGNEDEARAALSRSDELDPRYPRQRLQAVRLWGILGEPERGLEIARRVALLGSQFRDDAGIEALASGYTIDEALAVVRFEEMDDEQLRRFLRSLHGELPAYSPVVWGRLSPERLKSPGLRLALGRMAMKPLQPEYLADLWALEGATPDPATGWLLQNPGLDQPPYSTSFPLGWLLPDERNRYRILWQEPTLDREGHIRIDLPISGRLNLNYHAYRLLQPAGESARLTVNFQSAPPRPARLALNVRDSNTREPVHSVATSLEGLSETELTARIPSTGEARLLDVGIEWGTDGTTGSALNDPKLLITGIELEAASASETSP